MQLCLLHLDNALEAQPDFIATCQRAGAQNIRMNGSEIRLWGHRKNLKAFHDELKSVLGNGQTSRLCFMGSGDFHHVSDFLLQAALRDYDDRVTLLHFDNHPDWVHFEKGTHCGSWINRAAEQPKVERILTIGVCSHDLRNPEWKGANLDLLAQHLLELYPYQHAPSRVKRDYGSGASHEQCGKQLRWKTIRATGEQDFAEFLLTRIPTQAVYVTIDKDVLDRKDAVTNWDQGCMRLPYLLSLIKRIGSRHTIIGGDVTGDFSTPRYSGKAWDVLLKRAEIMLDQPRVSVAQSAHINSAGNHALLETLSEAMA